MRGLALLLMTTAGVVAATRAPLAEPTLETAADLVAFCDEDGPVGEVRDGQNFCDGFIAGSGLFYFELVRAGTIEKIACAEPTPTLAQARAAFVAWATANPEHMQSRPVDGFWRAMAETYPCPK